MLSLLHSTVAESEGVVSTLGQERRASDDSAVEATFQLSVDQSLYIFVSLL